MKKNHYMTLIITFIMMVLVPRLCIDLYLPSLPKVASSLSVSSSVIQMTMTIFMFGYAFSMLITGPLSDRYGHIKVGMLGICLFVLSSIGCAVSNNIILLCVARLFQALGGCCGTVIARVMIKDQFDKEKQMHLLAMLSLAMAVSPIVAPVVGGYLSHFFVWRWVFIILAIVGFIILSFLVVLRSSFHPTRRDIPPLLSTYKMLLKNPLFLGYSLTIGLSWFNYFLFTVESPILIQNVLHFSAIRFGELFALSVTGYVIGTRIARYLANRVGWNKLILIACFISIVGSLAMVLCLSLQSQFTWYDIVIPMIIIMVSVGVIIPCTQGAVMQPFPKIAGTAAGLFFFIQMMFGSVAGFIATMINSYHPIEMAMLMLLISILMLASFYLSIYRSNKAL